MAFIYAMYDPRDDVTFRYVGYTGESLQARLWRHISCVRHGEDFHKSRWIRQLLAEDIRPVMHLLEEVEPDPAVWVPRERYWIARLRELGHPLTNSTEGGEGAIGGKWKWSEEAKARQSARLRTMWQDPEYAAKQSATLSAYWQSEAGQAVLAKVHESTRVRAREKDTSR